MRRLAAIMVMIAGVATVAADGFDLPMRGECSDHAAPLDVLTNCWAPAVRGNYAGEVPQDVAIADFDGDGMAEVAVANAFSDDISFMEYSDGDGVLQLQATIPIGVWDGVGNDLPREMAAADFNGDGMPDLAVVSSGGVCQTFCTPPSLTILMNRGTPGATLTPGSFEIVAEFELSDIFTPIVANRLAVADVNHDGAPDIVVGMREHPTLSLPESDELRVFFSDGYDDFYSAVSVIELATGAAGTEDIVAADLDGDGGLEFLVVMNDRLLIATIADNGKTASTALIGSVVPDANYRAVAVADVDNDGRRDAVLASGPGELHVYHGLASDATYGSFEGVVIPGPGDGTDRLWGGMAAIDWNLDRRTELLVTDLNRDEVLIVRYDGAVWLHATTNTASEPRAIAIGDIDGDGIADYVTANEGDEGNASNSDVSLLLNPTEPAKRLTLNPEAEVALYTVGAPPTPLGLDDLVVADATSAWVVDREGEALHEISWANGTVLQTLAASTLGIGVPTAATPTLAASSDEIWVAEAGSNTLRRVSLTTGSLLSSVGVTGADIGSPGFDGIAASDDGMRLYLIESATGDLLRATLDAAPAAATVASVNQRVATAGRWRSLAYESLGATGPYRLCGLIGTTDSATYDLDAGGAIQTASFAPLFAGGTTGPLAGRGKSAIGPFRGGDVAGYDLAIAMTDGTLFELDASADQPTRGAPTLPGRRAVDLAIVTPTAAPRSSVSGTRGAEAGGAFVVLDGAPFAELLEYMDGLPTRSASLFSAQTSHGVVPAAVAFSAAAERCYVVDRDAPRIVTVTRTAATFEVEGVFDYSAEVALLGEVAPRFVGLAYNAATDTLIAATERELISLSRPESGPLAAALVTAEVGLGAYPSAIAFDSAPGAWRLLGPQPSLWDVESNAVHLFAEGTLTPNTSAFGLAIDPATSTAYVLNPTTGSIFGHYLPGFEPPGDVTTGWLVR